ncbi:hypothetical protein Patl1_28780 [Pistacia atlantica]|uniref:Uncharacterized protein n=1 Tax=Pistacia atlantica TaxID=434234 RepID=A0ACC1BDW6_9ROSI|nr:hypothetical protein Patl1_28780 [Pistacia atlantica]
MAKQKHFVFVEAACFDMELHWLHVRMELRSAGHGVTCIDLGTTGFNTKKWDEVLNLSEFLQPLTGFLRSLRPPQKVILVGHSYGGLSISLVTEKYPEKVLAAVFVSAFMPNHRTPPGFLLQDYLDRTPRQSFMDSQIKYDNGSEKPPTSIRFGYEYLRTKAYKNCPLHTYVSGFWTARTTRFLLEELSQENLLTKERYGAVDRYYVMSEEDDVIKPDFQREMVENYPPQQVVMIRGADHMVMLSKAAELIKTLKDIALKYK